MRLRRRLAEARFLWAKRVSEPVIRLEINSYSPLIQFGLRWHHGCGLSLWYRNCSDVLEHLGSGE